MEWRRSVTYLWNDSRTCILSDDGDDDC